MPIRTSASAIWHAIADADGLCNWMPTHATVEPGVGGSISMSWNGAYASTSRIVAWEPDHHLELAFAFGDLDVRQRWTIEPHDGGVILHLEHGPFPDPTFHDAVRRGWAFELRGLRLYLERHPEARRTVTSAVGHTSDPFESIWATLAPRLVTEPVRGGVLAEGDRCTVHGPNGPERAIVQVHEPPLDLAVLLPDLDDAYLRLRLDPDWGGELTSPDPTKPTRTINLWLSTWNIPPEAVAAWQTHLTTLSSCLPT
ncbi:MAG: SRPBCC domain-containing protein [Phycisphaerales bacterium]|nr:SRPBCC domain-containing protein [Phycisphaerales bacterium]